MRTTTRWLLIGLILHLCSMPLIARDKRRITVLPGNDQSGGQLQSPLQYAMIQLLQTTGRFQTHLSSHVLAGFTVEEIRRAMIGLNTELITFVYLEKGRLALFLFDSNQPDRYIVATRPTNQGNSARPSNADVELKLREAFAELMGSYTEQNFQPLPEVKKQMGEMADRDETVVENQRKSEEARRLFFELNKLNPTKIYIGAQIGLARVGVNSQALSSVNFGGYLGVQPVNRLFVETGINIFSYALANLDVRYKLPIGERFMSLAVLAGGGYVLGNITEIKGFSSSNLRAHHAMLGPGISVDIPLLGAQVRAEMKLYATGKGSVFFGSYGAWFSL